MDFSKNSKDPLNKSAEFILQGGVIIFPTDTVYGFLADASNKKAVEKIYKIKKRPKQKPLAVFVKDFKIAKELAEINKEQEKILKKKWPGKYTFVLRRKFTEVRPPRKLYGVDKKTIALRIPKYKLLNDLLKKINKPLVQTSVNISGSHMLKRINDITEQFSKYNVLVISNGNLRDNKPSKIIDLTQKNIKIVRK